MLREVAIFQVYLSTPYEIIIDAILIPHLYFKHTFSWQFDSELKVSVEIRIVGVLSFRLHIFYFSATQA